jgi:hypothetical protein
MDFQVGHDVQASCAAVYLRRGAIDEHQGDTFQTRLTR